MFDGQACRNLENVAKLSCMYNVLIIFFISTLYHFLKISKDLKPCSPSNTNYQSFGKLYPFSL